MKTLITFDERNYLYEKNSFERFIPAIQDIMSAYNLLKLEPVKIGELSQLFIKPDEFVFDKMIKSNPVLIGNLEVQKHKALEIFKKPEGYKNLLALIENIHSTLENDFNNNSAKRISFPAFINSFELDQNGNVILKASKDIELQEKHKKYATSEKAKKILALANLIVDKSKELDVEDIIKWDPDGIGHVLKGVLSSKYGEKGLKINVEGIMRYN